MSARVIRLTGDRVTLRDFVDTDLDAVHSYAREPVVTRFMDWGPNGIDETRTFIDTAMARASESTRMTYDLAIVEDESRELVGGASLRVTDTAHRRGEIGYVIHPDFWSRGLATDAAALLLQFGFRQLDLRRIEATCDPDNRASARVLEKAGLRFEGRLRSHLYVRGVWRDSLLFAAVDGDARQ